MRVVVGAEVSFPRSRVAAGRGGVAAGRRGTALLFPLLAVAGGAIAGIVWGAAPSGWGWIALAVAGTVVLSRLRHAGRNAARARHGGRSAATQGLPAAPPEAEDELRRRMQMFEDLGIALVVTGPGGAVLCANAMASEILRNDGQMPRAALDLSGAFFGLPVEEPQELASLHRFFGSEDEGGEGVVTCSGSRRQIYWRGRLLSGIEGFAAVRLFVVRDVTAERRLEAMKSDFLGAVSHELRTPLTSLRGSLQLILARAHTLGESDREMLEIGVKNTERLIRLTNDLLDVDRLERGTISFRFGTLDVRRLIETAVKTTAPACRARGIRVEVEADESLTAVHGDGERLLQVLVNLLDNAVRYAPAASPVAVRVRGRETVVQIDVCDRGPGIPAADQPHVFERFWRAGRGNGDGGTGLGLAICRAIVQRHGGRIWLESEEGRGTTFSMVLPRSVFRAQLEDIEGAGEPDASPRVLVIEDDPDTRAVTRASLELHGYDVLEAATGVQGLSVARAEQPGVILLDVILPDLDGHDVLRVLKNDPDTKDIPVIVLSVEPQPELAERLGAAGVLQKPARFEAVRCAIARALRRARQPEGHLVIGMGPAVSRDLAVLAQMLERDSHEVYRGCDLADLAAWSAAHFPDLLVLDEDMLPESRAEAAEVLRHPMTGVAIPLVLLTTGMSSDGESERCAHLGKPISKDEFMAAAQRLVTPASHR